MVIASVFGLSDRVRDTLLFLFVVIPLALLWVATLAHIVLRRDFARLPRLAWLVVVAIFPLVGTLAYLISQPAIREIGRAPRATLWQAADTAATLRQATATVGELSVALDHFATTASLAQSLLVQGASLIDDVSDLLAKADSTLGFTVPFTRLRPLGPAHEEVRALGAKSRALGRTLEQTAGALGTNVADLRTISGDVATIAGALGVTPRAAELLPGDGTVPPPPVAGQPATDGRRDRSGPGQITIDGVPATPAPPTGPSDPVPSP